MFIKKKKDCKMQEKEKKEKEFRMELEEMEMICFETSLSEQELDTIKQGVMQKIKQEKQGQKKITKEGIQEEYEHGKLQKWYHWSKWKKQGIAVFIIILMFGFFSPSIVSIAGKFYKNLPIVESISKLFQSEIKQDGYRVDIAIKEDNNNSDIDDIVKEQKETLINTTSFVKNIHIIFPKMDDYTIREKDGWYYINYKDGFSSGKDFDFQLIAVDKAAETGLFIDDIASMEKIKTGKHTTIYIERNDVMGSRYHDTTSYTKRMLLLFEEEGYIIQLYAMAGVEKEELFQFSENIVLEKCKKKEASSYITLSKYFMHNFDTKGQIGTTIVKTVRNDQMVSINETASRLGMEYEVKDVQVFDNISKFWKENGKGFNDSMDIWKHRFQYADKQGNLKSYVRETVEIGNGITAPLERVVKSEEIFQKFVLIELRVKNTTAQEKESEQICLNINYLKQQNDDWIDDERGYNYNRPKIINSCQLDCIAQYFKEADDGAGFYLKTFAPKEENTYHIGYFVDEDLLSSMFLSVDGGVWTGEYNGTMIDIRQ